MIEAGTVIGSDLDYVSTPVSTGVKKEREVPKDKRVGQYTHDDNVIIQEQLIDAATALGERGIQNVFFNNVKLCRAYVRGLHRAMGVAPLGVVYPEIAVRITEDGERWYSANYFPMLNESVAFPVMLFREPYSKERFEPKVTTFTLGL